MKRIFSVALATIILQSVSAQKSSGQVFKKFKVDVSLGYAAPANDGVKGGVIFVVEPKYALMDELSVGLRMEGAGLARVDEDGELGEVKVLSSYLLTGDYYFSNNKFRPFGGLGGGIFTIAGMKIDEDEIDVPSSSTFGFMARAGFEYGHLRMGVEYNFLKEKQGYLGIKLGVCIGGGLK